MRLLLLLILLKKCAERFCEFPMKLKNISKLKAISEMVYLAERRRVQAALVGESRAARQLAEFNHRSQEASNSLTAESTFVRNGADIGWYSWEIQVRERLTTNLMKARLVKLQCLPELHRAFGQRLLSKSDIDFVPGLVLGIRWPDTPCLDDRHAHT